MQKGPSADFQICRMAVLGERGEESSYLFQLFTNSNGNNFLKALEILLLYS